jgi:small-conductance mechanosensitive channel
MMVFHFFPRTVVFILVTAFGLAIAPGVSADTQPVKRTLSAMVKEWSQVLDRSDKGLQRAELSDEKLAEIRQDLSGLRVDLSAAVAEALPQTQIIRDELQTLGSPPAEGAPPESPAVTAKRKTISERLAVAEGEIKESDLILSRVNRLLADVNGRQRERYTQRILTRGQSPILPSVWKKAWAEAAMDLEMARQDIQYWVDSGAFDQEGRPVLRYLLLALLVAVILIWPLKRWLLRRFGYVSVENELTHGHRLRVAFFTGFVRILMPTAAVVAVYLVMVFSGLLTDKVQLLANTALQALVFLFGVSAFCHAALAPFEHDWRLVNISDVGARTVSRVVTLIALVFSLDQVMDQLRENFEASLELTLIHKFISGLWISGLLLILLQPPIWAAGEGEISVPARPWRRLRFLLRLLVLAIPLSAVLGFVALSRMLATQLVLTAGLYVAVRVIRNVGSEALGQGMSGASPLGRYLRSTFNLSDDDMEMLRFWITEIQTILVFVAGTVALLVLWGAGGDDLSAWLHTAFFGFRVGTITISIADILFAMLLFGALLAVTRLLQHWLDHRIFPRTRLDFGIRHSIRSATGYVGFSVAAVVAVSTVGIDLSSLAMIAGALSVGIGFGLQNIVNNFVSGLILLVERPIKVGDWVTVGDFQGYVKRISVRATEISTFDRASVFIPNSSLISGPVMNRTYADKVGRVILNLSLHHDADARKVRGLLLEVAGQHPEVMRNPNPLVFHVGFADGLLHMELMAFIRDVDKVKSVTSDLWFEIEDTFRREGIEIPSGLKDFRVVLDEDQLLQIAPKIVGAERR